ncbi:MAG: hypothetical protein HGA44_08085 [Cellulomonadaceae bacterium]|nr:hypothetical protein [Cellulomonadaceae bacterium]
MPDPSRGGLWVIATASGAMYRIDSRDLDRTPTLTRVTGELDPSGGLLQADLRRDGEPLALLAVHHHGPTGAMTPGLIIGAEAIFIIEPLAPDAAVTVRRTTPVQWIHRLDRDGPATGDGAILHSWSQPGPLTVPELVAARGADRWTTVADVAAAIAAELAGQADPAFAVRLLAEAIKRFRDGAQTLSLTTPPETTLDLRFDTLIAGIVQHLAHEQDQPAPDWARNVPPLRQPWAPLGRWTPPATQTWRELDGLNITLDIAFVEDV